MIDGALERARPSPRRPRLPADYGVPASDDGLLPWSWAEDRLVSARNYWVGTTSPDGSPHAMPVWAVWIDDELAFSTSPESRKGRNLARDPRVSVHVERDDDVVVIHGEAKEVPLDPATASVYEEKYGYHVEPGTPGESWFRVRPRVVYAWDRDFPRTATRFVFGRDGR